MFEYSGPSGFLSLKADPGKKCMSIYYQALCHEDPGNQDKDSCQDLDLFLCEDNILRDSLASNIISFQRHSLPSPQVITLFSSVCVDYFKLFSSEVSVILNFFSRGLYYFKLFSSEVSFI